MKFRKFRFNPAVEFPMILLMFLKHSQGFLTATNASSSKISHILLLDQKIFQHDIELRQLKNRATSMDETINQMQKILSDKDRTIAGLEASLKSSEIKLANMTAQVSLLENRIDKIEYHTANAGGEMENLNASFAKCKTEFKALNASLLRKDMELREMNLTVNVLEGVQQYTNTTLMGHMFNMTKVLSNMKVSIENGIRNLENNSKKLGVLEVNQAVLRNDFISFKSNTSSVMNAMMTDARLLGKEASVLKMEQRNATLLLQKNIMDLQNVSDTIHRRINFRALLTHNLTDIQSKYVIVFDTVLDNIGNGYNNSSGIFTATVEGYYMFTAFAHAEPANFLRLLLKQDNNVIGNYFISPGSTTWQAAIVTSGAYMKANEKVYVVFDGRVAGTVDFRYPSAMFSGYLM